MALPLKKKTVTERKKVETTKKDSAYIIQVREWKKKQGLNENELFVAKNCCITIESVLGRKTCESLSKCLYGARNMEELA